ncbi:hypothetical protein [Marinobacter salexigens]|uniref:Uncharacterized protein n=1 Tax=Marinobacter salexigens TaxID=1925763 RepID=A0ABS6AB35_9GAMM|nr:hypothetical protein [Marinobacter salexigens]MBU2874974.1 hypothetical protein [Marinobacter salexigens]
MPEIFFARNLVAPKDLFGADADSLKAFLRTNGLNERELIQPGRAYSFEPSGTFALAALRRLNSLPSSERMCLAKSADVMGDEARILRTFFETYLSPQKLSEINSLVGAGATAAFARLNGFQQALVNYQKAVLDVAKLKKDGGSGIGAQRAQSEAKLRVAYTELKEHYRVELNKIAPEAYRNKNRGNALSNPERAITLASRSTAAKPDPRLFVADANDAGSMGQFSRVLNNTGRIAVAVDAGLRVNKVYTIHDGGGDWMRESAVQMVGFGAGGAVGGLTGKAVVGGGTMLAAKAGFLVAGPLGWAALGVIVGAGVLAGLLVGSYADKEGQGLAASIWDR